jgi:hypothetical protein
MLNKTSCLCGRELKEVRFDKYIPMKMNDKFYGGRVTMTGELRCECGRDLKGYFQRVSNEIELIDLEVVNDITEVEKNDLKPISSVDFNEMSYKEIQEYAKSKGIEKVNVKREELIEQLK